MPRIPRKDVIDRTEVGVFHCINCCVPRAFLCGADPITGKNYDHRKAWLQDRMQFLAGIFGIDLLGFAILSNHFHIILRIRPEWRKRGQVQYRSESKTSETSKIRPPSPRSPMAAV